jgi:uncharacterized repeat protein (TIGR02543 family)
MNVSFVLADEIENSSETRLNESDLESDYSQEEYDEFYKDEPISEREEVKVYYYVTFVDKVNNIRKEVKVEENKTVDEIEVKKAQIRLKGNKVKIFNYWVDANGKKYDFSKKVTKNITLYAKYYIEKIYEKNFAKYSVQFVSQGETVANELSSNKGLINNPKTLYRKGYTFLGWYTNSNGGYKWDFKKDVVEENLKLYARWTKNTLSDSRISPKTGYDRIENFVIMSTLFSLLLLVVSLYKVYTIKESDNDL